MLKLFMTYVHKKGHEAGESTLTIANTFGSKPYTQQEWYTIPKIYFPVFIE